MASAFLCSSEVREAIDGPYGLAVLFLPHLRLADHLHTSRLFLMGIVGVPGKRMHEQFQLAPCDRAAAVTVLSMLM